MTVEEIKNTINLKINELPTLPVVIPKILKMMENSKSSVEQISEVIMLDPALASKILKVANSAYYGFSKKISEIDRAVALLGFNMVKSLALSLGVMKNMPRSKNGKSKKHFSEEALWTHSIAVASTIRKITRDPKFKKHEYMFVVGLLHDIGKTIFDQYFNGQYSTAIDKYDLDETLGLAKIEQELFGIDHGEVGAILLKKWKFPEEIISPIAIHHKADIEEQSSKIDLAILRVADRLSQKYFYKDKNKAPEPEFLKEDLEILGYNDKSIEDLKESLSVSDEKIFSFLGSLS